MPLIIGDDILKEAGLSEGEAKIEFACRLFASGKISKLIAGRLCGLDRIDFAMECGKRGIDAFGYTAEDLDKDMATLDRVLGKL
jgi:predicted HTH domain antitoxin